MSTVFVTLSDAAYYSKAKRTIIDLRTAGQWTGHIVYIAVDFQPNENFCRFYGVTVKSFPRIPTERLIQQYREQPLSIPTHDRREFAKVTQWEKLHAFDPYFCAWERVVFLDAGLRIFDSVRHFLSLKWRGRLLAQDDTGGDTSKGFGCQLELKNNPEALGRLVETYGADILTRPYFLNCMWIYDTALLETVTKEELIDVMNDYPLWRTNEMGVMNVVFAFKYRVWSPFPVWTAEQQRKRLFDWCETNNPGTRWYDYCALKYPITINMECE